MCIRDSINADYMGKLGQYMNSYQQQEAQHTEDPVNFDKHIKISFLIICAISVLTCFARPDYNLPIFAFAYLFWLEDKTSDAKQRQTVNNQKIRFFALFIFSIIVDAIWIPIMWRYWLSSEFPKNYWESGIHKFVLICSGTNFFVKIISIFLVYTKDEIVKKGIKDVGEQLKAFFTCSVDTRLHSA
eukprot:TRINITY_DN1576_c0_g1_i12.p1 TRINITY_DN1576_c0_g1~~TRINITY_DN1576_c0_g1_i12.p1  ORF type:complete len:186 (-),score=23.04 TRINITY_DN1576_c0_g1_i12:91-648(-)